MHKYKLCKTLFLAITVSSLLLSACGQSSDYEEIYIDEYADEEAEYGDEYAAEDDDEEGIYIDEFANDDTSEEQADDVSYTFTSTLTDEGQIIKKNSDGYVVFYSGDFYGGLINSSEDALSAVYESIDVLCDNPNISLEEDLVVSNKYANVYTFRQVYNGDVVDDSIVKVATDPDGNVLGLISSLKSGKISEEDLVEPDIYMPEDDYFAGKTASTWTGTIKDIQNNTIDITVPVVTDPKNGKTYLADLDRRIICVDYDDPGTIDDPNVFQPGVGPYSDYVLLYYEHYINIYDFYVERGWISPNGRKTPSLLNIDIGTGGTDVPINMAAYTGCVNGYEMVELSARLPNEIDYFTIGHEFTHIISGANHVGPYINEYGTIDESISDIMGNIIDMTMMNCSSSEWFAASFEDTTPDGYSYKVWDAEYTPPVFWNNALVNDHGNVHHNSGIISSISYRLYKAGMSLEDQFPFWLMADIALSPNTDFEMFADKLPWCMEITGFSQYEEALLAAIDACGMKNTKVPDSPPDGMALLRFKYPNLDFCEKNEIYFTYYNMDTGYEKITWPSKDTGEVALVLYPGNYTLSARIEGGDDYYLYYYDTWLACTEEDIYTIPEADPNMILEVEEDFYFVLETEGLP